MENLEINVMLVEKAQQGNKEAMEALCKSSMRSIYYVALKILKNEADAEDIMADTMVTIVEKLNTLSVPAAYLSWVNRITVNKCKNYLAKNKPIYLGEEEQQVIENAEIDNYNEEFLPEEFVLSKEKTSALMEIIKEKTTYAEMMSVIMFYYNGDSIKTIAAEMECAEITVKTRLASARKKIKKGLEEKFGKGVMLMATAGLFVLSKALKAEAAETVVPREAALAAAEAVMGSFYATVEGSKEAVSMAKLTTDVALKASDPSMNALGKKIGKEVGKKVIKDSLKGKIIAGVVGVVAAAGVTTGVVMMVSNSGEGGANNGTNVEDTLVDEDVISSETYKLLYKTDDKVYYYSNHNEHIVEFSGYQKLDQHFYNNVTCGRDADYNDFLMDIKGKYIVEPGTYDNINRVDSKNEKHFWVTKDDKTGIIDYQGNVVIPLEYSDIDYNEDDGVVYYIAENDKTGKYTMFSENGSKLLEADEKMSSVETYKAYTSKSVDTLLYEGTLYSLKTGEKLVAGLNEGTYSRNLYHKDGKITVYDATFNVKKEITDVKYNGFETDEMGHIVLNSDTDLYLNENYELVEVEKVDNTKHVLANGEKYSSKIDEEAKIVYIYDESGKELHAVPFDGMTMVEKVYSHENYLVIQYTMYDWGRLIDIHTGEVLIDRIGGFYENDKNDIVYGFTEKGSNSEVFIVSKDFVLQLGKNYLVSMNKNGFWAYDENNKIVYEYGMDGKVKSEITGVEKMWMLADDCNMFICDDGKARIISNEDGKIISEFDYTSEDMYSGGHFPYEHNNDNIGIIQLSDGLYNLKGEKLVDVTME